MSLFFNQLKEQTDLLKNKGYDEKSLSSPDKGGWLFNQLQRSFSDALHQSFQEGGPISFSLCTTGFFNDNKDIVHFKLDYSFHLEENDLKLRTLEIEGSSIKTKIDIQLPDDLPHSSTALGLLKQSVKVDQRKTIHQPSAYKHPPKRRIN